MRRLRCYSNREQRCYSWLTLAEGAQPGGGLEEVKMSHCPARCMTCRDEARQERHKCRTHHERISHCRTRPMPHPHVTVEDIEEEEEDMFTHNDLPELQEDLEESDDEEEEEECLEKGDRIYTVDLPPRPEHKIYPMSQDEQAELDTYIDEHLLSGCI